VISSPNELLKIQNGWNTAIKKFSENPLSSSGFVKQFMEFNRSRGWTPLILVISTDNTIVGISPLTTKKIFGMRFAKFLSGFRASSSFIVDDQYRETCMAQTLDFLFSILRCQIVNLTLPAESPNLPILKQKCETEKIYFCTRPATGHCTIPTKRTWDEFVKSRNHAFRSELKRMQRKLDRAGSWRTTCIKNGKKESDAFERILNVERTSWKEAWRTQVGTKMDEDLLMIWNGAQHMATTEPDFKWRVWFLELNGQTLAYCLVIQYKKTAFIVKTSYNVRYKRLYPGIYVNNVAIRELFNERQVRNIDFTTDLPFMRTWASTCLPRVRVMMSRKGVSSILLSIIAKLEDFLRLKLSDVLFLPLTKKEILRTFWPALREGKVSISRYR
jgi:hypothetical protein